MRKKSFIALTVAMVLFGSITSYAGQWKQDSKGWWYQNDDGSYPANKWSQINGEYYYFNSSGYMLANTTTPDGYKVGSDGTWLNGSESQRQGISESQKKIIKDSLEIFLYQNKWKLDANIHEPIITSDLSNYDIGQLLNYHLIVDSSNATMGYGTTFPLFGESRNGEYSFNYDQSKKMMKDLYGQTVSDSSVKQIMNVSGNNITCYPGDPDRWTSITIQDCKISNDELFVYMNYKTVVSASEQGHSEGKLGARYKKNADSFFGYTLLSVWNDN